MKLYYTEELDGSARVWFSSKKAAEKARQRAYRENPELKPASWNYAGHQIKISEEIFQNTKAGILKLLNNVATNGDETNWSTVANED